MALAKIVRHLPQALSRFIRGSPWFVSPVKIPCGSCTRKGTRDSQSTVCENFSEPSKLTCANNNFQALPVFKSHHEPSNIQLFYDLFFVANLSACTSNHPIMDRDTLASYVGFFSLLWFTWFDTILFDVRFAIDSWFIRLSKFCSFGIMAAFAVSSVFPTSDSISDQNDLTFGHNTEMVSLVLMTSRLILVIQYGVVLVAVQLRHREPAVTRAFVLTMSTSLAAAMVFLGLAFNRNPMSQKVGW